MKKMLLEYGGLKMAKISLSLEQINTIITKINSASEQISTSWNSIKTDDLTKIRSSWAEKDCESYIAKAEEMDNDMQKAIQALKLLSATYLKAQQNIVAIQERITATVSGLWEK